MASLYPCNISCLNSFWVRGVGSEQMLFAHYRELMTLENANAFFGLLPDPAAVAESVEFDKLPKHVPPRIQKRMAEELRTRFLE